MEHWLPVLTALWLGILTSISPCPLASNIAAVSFVSYRLAHRGMVLLSGFIYALGRSLTYTAIGFLLTKTLVSVPILANLLQGSLNKVLGFVLIGVGLYLLDVFSLRMPGMAVSHKWQQKVGQLGITGSLFLGILFALAFCPVSAALFFGSLIPITLQTGWSLGLPFVYGIGTAAPVLIFAILIAAGSGLIHVAYQKVTRVEFYTRKLTGVIFVLVGVYYVLAYTLRLI